jgi:hypothetical protein
MNEWMNEWCLCSCNASANVSLTSKVLHVVGTMSLGIHYKPGNKKELAWLHDYSDSDLTGNVNDRKSTNRLIYFLNKGPISWQPSNERTLMSPRGGCIGMFETKLKLAIINLRNTSTQRRELNNSYPYETNSNQTCRSAWRCLAVSPWSTYSHKHAQPSRSSEIQIMQLKHKREDTWFIPWFNSPSRLGYLHIVEEAKMALESLSTRSSSLTHHQGDELEVSTKILDKYKLCHAHHKHGSSLGNA